MVLIFSYTNYVTITSRNHLSRSCPKGGTCVCVLQVFCSAQATMRASQVCPICDEELEDDELVVIRKKGADNINHASTDRGDNIVVSTGDAVHKRCRLDYTNKKNIERHKQAKLNPPPPKRSARVSAGPYDKMTQCLYCAGEVNLSRNEEYSWVKTEMFVRTILSKCQTRNDSWAIAVQGRIEFFGKDLHAADAIYHRSCDVNFRTNCDIPEEHRTEPIEKHKKVGRPKDCDQDQAFLKICSYFEENDEEQLTVAQLAQKMKEYLREKESMAYGNQYLKSKLIK